VTAVTKSSSRTSRPKVMKNGGGSDWMAAAIQRIFDDAGFPAGAYVNIYATNEQVADVIADPRVQGVSVTGSERAGAAVAEIAGRNLKKVVLELGGSDPFVLLSADDLDGVVESAVAARLENAGQACNAAKRFVVAADLYDPFVDKLTAALTAAVRRSKAEGKRRKEEEFNAECKRQNGEGRSA
jgi:succinate-semialdehyde dehydrogenase/glutarate-semialdehyde dehydrogenase